MWRESATADAPHDHQHAMRRESSTGPRAGPFGGLLGASSPPMGRDRLARPLVVLSGILLPTAESNPGGPLAGSWATRRPIWRAIRPIRAESAQMSSGRSRDAPVPLRWGRTSPRFGPPPAHPAARSDGGSRIGSTLCLAAAMHPSLVGPTDQRRSGSAARLTGAGRRVHTEPGPDPTRTPGATPTSSPGRRPRRGPGP